MWADAQTCPSNLTTVFALDDDFSIGVLSSRAHGAWLVAQSSTLEDRTRYTTSSVFTTFPWPARARRDDIGVVSAALIALRSRLCLEHSIGLTELYNVADEGGFAELQDLHRRLDDAVARAYGWPLGMSDDAWIARLLELNRRVTARDIEYAGPPGGQKG